jgi:hypothetical protein
MTRRTKGRHFFLKPGSEMDQVVKYCMARAAERAEILIHNFAFMSNHEHVTFTDPKGRHPEFTQWMNLHIAKCGKILWDIPENMWDNRKPHIMELENEEALFDSMCYVYENPVTSKLVRTASQWPGVISRPNDLYGYEEVIKPPPIFFKPWSDVATLKVCPPPMLADWNIDQLVADLKKRNAAIEAEMAAIMRDENRRYLTPEHIRNTNPWDQPSGVKTVYELRQSFEVVNSCEHDAEHVKAEPKKKPESNASKRQPRPKNRVPKVKALFRSRAKLYLEQLRIFHEHYRQAFQDMKNGLPAVFPYGTYWLWKYCRVQVTPPD